MKKLLITLGLAIVLLLPIAGAMALNHLTIIQGLILSEVVAFGLYKLEHRKKAVVA